MFQFFQIFKDTKDLKVHSDILKYPAWALLHLPTFEINGMIPKPGKHIPLWDISRCLQCFGPRWLTLTPNSSEGLTQPDGVQASVELNGGRGSRLGPQTFIKQLLFRCCEVASSRQYFGGKYLLIVFCLTYWDLTLFHYYCCYLDLLAA